MNLGNHRKLVDKKLLQLEAVRMNYDRIRKSYKSSRYELESLEQAREIAQSISQKIQQKAHTKISSIVTKCLKAVFDDPYEFCIRFDKKRGKTEAVLVLKRDGEEYEDPKNEVGGGVIDVVALSLRVACVLLSRPVRRKILVLDEPFRNVRGKQNRKRLRGMLQALSNETGFQFIINIDADSYPEFVLGTVIDIEG